MSKMKYFPVFYAVISALIAFIAFLAIGSRTFHLPLPAAVAVAGVAGVIFYVISYFRGHASSEIKRITAKFSLTDRDLAMITHLKPSDFPIYHDQLQLIIPKHKWPQVLDALQRYEKEHDRRDDA